MNVATTYSASPRFCNEKIFSIHLDISSFSSFCKGGGVWGGGTLWLLKFFSLILSWVKCWSSVREELVSHKIISKQDKPTEMKDLTLVRDSTVVRDYKNITWAWSADRKFRPRGHCLASRGCAEWHQIVILRDGIFYPHWTLMFDPFSGISFDFEYFRKVKRSAMIRNWYNQIPHPALKTKREITKYINWRQFTKGTRSKPNEQLR